MGDVLAGPSHEEDETGRGPEYVNAINLQRLLDIGYSADLFLGDKRSAIESHNHDGGAIWNSAIRVGSLLGRTRYIDVSRVNNDIRTDPCSYHRPFHFNTYSNTHGCTLYADVNT